SSAAPRLRRPSPPVRPPRRRTATSPRPTRPSRPIRRRSGACARSRSLPFLPLLRCTLAAVLSSEDIRPLRVADVVAWGEPWPVYVHLVEHPDGRVLVDTGMTELHEYGAEFEPTLYPLTDQDLDLSSVDVVVNTHLHFDHCGGNHLSPASPSTSSGRS